MKDPEHTMTAATMVSEEKVPWKDVLASIEFKRMAKTKTGLRPLPPSYAVTDYVATYPEHWAVVSGTAATDGPRLQRQAHRRPDCPENHLQSSSKRVKVKVKDPKLDVTVQTGLYAAEMFAANVAVKHVLEIIVVGLGSKRALQKAEKEGYLKLNIYGMDLKLHTSSEEGVTHYGLKGRVTNVFPITSEFLARKYANDPDVKKDGLVAKIFWAEQDRTSEPEILKKKVLKALGVPEAEKDSHMLYIFVSRKLLPITALEGEELFNVWRQCILCHIDLWKGGVRHRDVSPPNMMFHKTDKGVLIGVLNDFNLSSLATRLDPHGNERTGTVPFIAPDLLSLRVDEAKSNTYIEGSSPTTGDSPFGCMGDYRPRGMWREEVMVSESSFGFQTVGNGPTYMESPCGLFGGAESRCRPLVLSQYCTGIKAGATDDEESASDVDDEQTNAEVSESDIDDFLHKFTSLKSWIRLGKRLP
ncbi:uncharacterized protein EDB91DRAFT_1335703 [Suillus paluster]|uniref:uncharacterized protein n=1 Tax=Suillus paluster TaxID=48578 RepID=UPI001B86713C|nr:uncharacterized protein EDB91DRAFT_1335703 [Suillus paluster]KAG1744139.1 hypothetical protein EDB91DRAFT_1335703 [Suillus paluster]